VELVKARKIAVVGNSGAGKSTLSEKLGKRLDIDVLSIDKIYWLPKWQLRKHESFKTIHDKWLETESWIIEGVGYWTEMELRISEADIVIFVDVPIDVCKARAEKRIGEERLSRNPYITEGCEYTSVKDRQMEVIEYFHSSLRPKIIDMLSGFSKEKVIIISDYSGLNVENET
jgi:adenylate kinase family enzyme